MSGGWGDLAGGMRLSGGGDKVVGGGEVGGLVSHKALREPNAIRALPVYTIFEDIDGIRKDLQD